MYAPLFCVERPPLPNPPLILPTIPTHPCTHPPHLQIARQVMDGGRPPIPPPDQLPGGGGGAFAAEGLSRYVSLLQACWAQDPAARPSFADILAELR